MLQSGALPNRDYRCGATANLLVLEYCKIDARRIVGHLAPRCQTAFPDHHRLARTLRDQPARLPQGAVIDSEGGVDLFQRGKGEAAIAIGPSLFDRGGEARGGGPFEIPASMMEVGVVDIQDRNQK